MAFYNPSTWSIFKPGPEQTKQMGQIGTILSFFGTINSAVGTYYSSQAQISALKHQAEMEQINARIAERSAQSRMLQGQKDIGRLTLKAGQLKSKQRVSLAANGVVLGEGSAAEIIASTDLMKEIDANQIFINATQDAWSIRTGGLNNYINAQSALAKAGSISPLGASTGSLLSGAGTVASNWYAMNN